MKSLFVALGATQVETGAVYGSMFGSFGTIPSRFIAIIADGRISFFMKLNTRWAAYNIY